MNMQDRDTKELKGRLVELIYLIESHTRLLRLKCDRIGTSGSVQEFEDMESSFSDIKSSAEKCIYNIYLYKRSWRNQE